MNGPTRSRSRGATRDATRDVRDVRGRRVRVDPRIERAERRAGSEEGERDLARGAREGSGRGDRSTRDAPGGGPSRRSAARPWTRRISRAARRSRRAVARNARGGEGEGGEGTATVRHRRGGRRRRVKWTWARLGSGTPGVGTHHVEDVEGLRRLLLLRLGLLIVLVFHLHVGTHRGARGRARRKRAEVWRGAIAREEKKRTNPPRLRRRRNFEPPRRSTAMTRPFLVYACRTRRVRSGR